MEGMGDGQPPTLNPSSGQLFSNGQHSRPLAGDHHTLWSIDRGDGDFVFIRGKHFLHACFRDQQRDHLPILRQRSHQSPARRDQFQPIGQTKDTRHTRRRHFPHTVANQQIWLNAPTLPQLRQRILKDKERRLGVGSVVKRVACCVLRAA